MDFEWRFSGIMVTRSTLHELNAVQNREGILLASTQRESPLFYSEITV